MTYKKLIKNLLLGFLICLALIKLVQTNAFAASDSWVTSLHDVARTGASLDTNIATTSAGQLAPLWKFQTGGPIASQPTVVNGTVYVGSWDGYEYALNATTGTQIWKTFLGITTANPICIPPKLGISSAATVQNGTVYLGGGDSNWYALNATNGAVMWSVPTGDNSATGGHYNWSSPLIYNGFAYIGVASEGDCPLVQGQLLKVDLNTHQVVATLNVVPNGQVGGGIWTSPSVDTTTNTIYVTTGTENSNTQSYAQAFLAVDANTLAIKDSWKLPENQAVLDSDFGTSATLFSDSSGNQLVGAINKNGQAYVFKRSNLAAGPIWQGSVAVGGFCPTCGESSVSSGTFGQGNIYFGGEVEMLNGQGYLGSIQAFNPANGTVIWQHGATGPVIGALTNMNGMVISEPGNILELLDSANGRRLYSYNTGSQIYAAASVANGVIYTGNVAGTVYAFAVANPITPPTDTHCPTGFTCQDVGTVTPTGSETVSSGTWSIAAGGIGYGNATDGFRLMSQNNNGDTQIIAKITAQQNVSNFSQTGIMLRQTNDPGSPFYSVYVNPNGSLGVQVRSAFGGNSGILTTKTGVTLPVFLEIQRVGDQLTAATSTDGVNFTLVPGSTTTMVMPYKVMAGLAVSSDVQGTSGSATISNVTIGAVSNSPIQQPPASSCPTGFSCTDVGNPNIVGDQSLTSGTWTMKGAGNDIWSNYDQFHYAYKSVTGDQTLSAKVLTVTNTDPNNKNGVMFRQGLAADAGYYAAYYQSDGNIHVQFRQDKGLIAGEQTFTAATLPAFIEIARSGSTLTTYTSQDGTNWTPVANSSINIATLGNTMLAGLAVSSHNGASLDTATFSNLTFTNGAPTPPNVCPTGWSCQDIGSPAPTPNGGQTLSSGTWTVLAGGSDIWGTSDSFRFIAQPQSFDGNIIADMTSQTNTDPWAKAGVMYRASNAIDDVYYGLFMTPGHGLIVQYRSTKGGSSTQPVDITTATLPTYFKIGRVGTTFTSYTSTDGVNWTAVPGSAISMTNLTGNILAGMAVTSHNPSAAGTVVYTNVSINAAGGCPNGFTCQDIGSPAVHGSTTTTNNAMIVSGAGNDIWQTTDQFQLASTPLTGDGSVTARVLSQTNTDPWAKAGVMIKQAAVSGSPYVMMAVTPSNGLHMQYNFNGDTGGGTYTFPVWVRVTRAGNIFTAATSVDGNTWTTVGSTSLTMTSGVVAGVFTLSHNGTTLGVASFDNVAVTSSGGSGGGPVPAPWSDIDVGNPPLAGSASFNNGVFTINGNGNDIWGTTDQFNFVSQTATADSTITARVTSQGNSDPWAKTGVMIKQSTTAGSTYAAMVVTPGNNIHMQYNFNGDVGNVAYTFPNAWVRIKKSGTTLTGYTSPDGTTWTQIGTTTLAINTPYQIGLYDTSHNSGQISTVTMDNVTVTSP